MLRAPARASRAPEVLLFVAVLAWIVIVAGSLYGHGGVLDHHALFERAGHANAHQHHHLRHGGVHAGPQVGALVVFGVAWLVMIAGMMLPSTVTTIRAFGRVAGAQAHPTAVVAAFVLMYFVVWGVFGVLVVGVYGALTSRRPRDRVVAIADTADWCGVARGRRRISVHACQVGLPGPVSPSFRVVDTALPSRHRCGLQPRYAPCRVLSRLLLGAHAPDVLARHRRHRVDAVVNRRDDVREGRAIRRFSAPRGRIRIVARCRRDCVRVIEDES